MEQITKHKLQEAEHHGVDLPPCYQFELVYGPDCMWLPVLYFPLSNQSCEVNRDLVATEVLAEFSYTLRTIYYERYPGLIDSVPDDVPLIQCTNVFDPVSWRDLDKQAKWGGS